MVLVALLLAMFAAVMTPVASAAPTPTPTPSPSFPTAPAPPEWNQPDEPEPSTSPTDPSNPSDPAKPPKIDLSKVPKDGSDGILQPFDVRDGRGVPISAYEVKTDTGGWNDIDLKIWNIFSMLFFGIAKWVIGFTCWLIEWALNFGLADILVGPVDTIATTIKTRVIDRLGLPGLFLTFAGLYTGWLILFKERSRGFAEIAVSLIVAAVATTVLVSPAQVLLGQHDQPQPQGSTMLLSDDGLLGTARSFTLEVGDIVLSENPKRATGSSDPDSLAKPITDALTEAFIVKPNQLMVYGRTFDGACDKAFRDYKLREYNLNHASGYYWQIQAYGYLYDPAVAAELDKAHKKFQKACGKEKPEAKRASADLTFSALFVAIAAVIVAVLIVLVTGGFLTSQGWVAFEAIRGHWALCAGILPGGGRAALWRWCSAVTKALLGVILAILFLAIFILIVFALIDADTGDVLAVKFIVIDVAAIAGLAGHKRLKATAQSIAVNLNRRLVNARVAGSRRSVFNSPGRYAETAPGLRQMWGEARGEARKVSQPVGKGFKSARNAWVGPRQGARNGGRLRSAARLATTAATAVGTGGAGAAAKVAAKQTLKKRLATAAASKMSQTRGGRAALAGGKVAAATAKYGGKAGKFALMATVGAPVGIPRGVAATKRAAAAAGARAEQVREQLTAAKDRTRERVETKVLEANAFGAEYKHNLGVASRYVAQQGTKAQLRMGLASIDVDALHSAPTEPAVAPLVPGPKAPASPTKPAAEPSPKPSTPPRPIRRATRPAGPPKPRP